MSAFDLKEMAVQKATEKIAENNGMYSAMRTEAKSQYHEDKLNVAVRETFAGTPRDRDFNATRDKTQYDILTGAKKEKLPERTREPWKGPKPKLTKRRSSVGARFESKSKKRKSSVQRERDIKLEILDKHGELVASPDTIINNIKNNLISSPDTSSIYTSSPSPGMSKARSGGGRHVRKYGSKEHHKVNLWDLHPSKWDLPAHKGRDEAAVQREVERR